MRLSYIAATAAVLSIAASAAQASIITYEALLAPEITGQTGSGAVTVTYDSALQTLVIDADWTGLSGTTTIAHIHCCTASPNTVGVAVTPGTLPGFPTGVTAGTYESPALDLTTAATYAAAFISNFGGGTVAGAELALIAGMTNGTAYFNIHTTTFAGGEIRGFLRPTQQVPEPATLALLGSGLVGLAAARRRRP